MKNVSYPARTTKKINILKKPDLPYVHAYAMFICQTLKFIAIDRSFLTRSLLQLSLAFNLVF